MFCAFCALGVFPVSPLLSDLVLIGPAYAGCDKNDRRQVFHRTIIRWKAEWG